MSGIRKTFAAGAALVLVSVTASAQAALSGAFYQAGNANNLASVNDALSAIATVGSPTVTFAATNVNGAQYTGTDNSTIGSWLGADSATIVNGTGTAATVVGTFVVDQSGFFIAPTSGIYTFSSSDDDGGGFFVDGTGTPGSGTAVAIDNGQHGQMVVTDTLTLSAGTHAIEYVYYNSSIGGNGGATSNNVTITDPNGAAVATSAVPEPATLALIGLGSLGLLARRRRA